MLGLPPLSRLQWLTSIRNTYVPFDWTFGPVLLLSAMAFMRYAYRHRRSLLGTRKFFSYPPPWFAGFLALPLVYSYGSVASHSLRSFVCFRCACVNTSVWRGRVARGGPCFGTSGRP